MIYALNLFNFIPGKEDQYRRYSVLAGKIIYGLGGRVVAAGHAPLQYLHGDRERRQMVIVAFPSEAAFQQFMQEAERQNIHELREGATTDYIWTLFEPWDMRSWVKQTAGTVLNPHTATRPLASSVQDSRPTLVLIPGLLCNRALWEPQIAALSDLCMPWVADVTRDDSIDSMAQRVLEEAPAERFALAGLSMGGYVAMQIMRIAPERVTRLALLDTRARPDPPEESERRLALMQLAQRERAFTPVTSRMLPLLVHPARTADEALVALIRQMAESVGLPAYLKQQRAVIGRPDFRPELNRITCPTLVLCGREDAITTLEMHHEIATGIAHAKLVVVEQCGHLSTLERPTQVNAALRGWLQSSADSR
jgi:pimeloyl-ACP methyl ester carboxylesterase